MESIFEEDSQLRRCVEHELVSNTALTPDQALKVQCLILLLSTNPVLQINLKHLKISEVFLTWIGRKM